MTTAVATQSAFERLVGILQTITHLKRAESVLNYDRMVFMRKAPEAAMARGAQISALAIVLQEKTTDRSLFDLLEQAEKDVPADQPDAPRLLELTRKTLEETARIPADLVARKAEHGALAHCAWAKARENNYLKLPRRKQQPSVWTTV